MVLLIVVQQIVLLIGVLYVPYTLDQRSEQRTQQSVCLADLQADWDQAIFNWNAAQGPAKPSAFIQLKEATDRLGQAKDICF